jgi:hypothetical protein
VPRPRAARANFRQAAKHIGLEVRNLIRARWHPQLAHIPHQRQRQPAPPPSPCDASYHCERRTLTDSEEIPPERGGGDRQPTSHTPGPTRDLIGETLGPLDSILADLHPRETYGFCSSREVASIKRAGDAPAPSRPPAGQPGAVQAGRGVRAAEWIARGVTQADDGPAEGEEGYDEGLPAISAAWRPWQDDGCATSDLLSSAHAAGVITCPPGTTIEYEQITDQDGGGYRWMVFLGDEGPG